MQVGDGVGGDPRNSVTAASDAGDRSTLEPVRGSLIDPLPDVHAVLEQKCGPKAFQNSSIPGSRTEMLNSSSHGSFTSWCPLPTRYGFILGLL